MMMNGPKNGPMEGLMASQAMMGSDEDNTGGSQVATLLQEAIALHEGHMSGTEPVDEASQQRLMDLLQSALVSLGVSHS